MANIHQNTIDCVEINPNSPAMMSIIWLHGLGADGHDFTPIIPQFNLPSSLPIRFVFPHAPVIPVTINQGFKMRAWFDIYELSKDSQIDKTGIANSVQILEGLIKREEKRGIDSRSIILAGFSQGAVIALTTALQSQTALGGVIALSGYLPLASEILSHASQANAKLPIFIAHGTEDPIIPYALGEATSTALKQANYPVTWHSYPMPHAVCTQEITDMSEWIQLIDNKGHTNR